MAHRPWNRVSTVRLTVLPLLTRCNHSIRETQLLTMKFIIPFLLSQSILLPIIVGLIRLRRLDKGYQPFFILLGIGFLTEVVSFILIQGFHTWNAIPVNIYNLAEWTLIVWQFHAWGFLRQKKAWFYTLLIFAACLWMTENLVFMNITSYSPYF